VSFDQRVVRVGLRRARSALKKAEARACERVARCGRRVDGAGVALTFDDGPDPTCTPRILDALSARGAVATFFLIGANAQRSPDLVRRIVAEGHAVGSHSYRHAHLRHLSARDAQREIVDGRDAIEDIVQRSVPLFRPPYGQLSTTVARFLRAGDWTTWHWSISSWDWRDDASLVRRSVASAGPGDVVLLHDTHEVTVATLPRVLDDFERRHVPFVALPSRQRSAAS